MYANVFLEKSIFTFIKLLAWMIPILLLFASLWIQWSMNKWLTTFFPYFLFFFLLRKHIYEISDLFLNAFMNVCNFLGIQIWYMFEYMFFLENIFMNAWFLGMHIMYVWVNSFWENTFMNAWFFWNAYIMYV